MLKPRYPLSECEIPQMTSDSTPSTGSSPFTTTGAGTGAGTSADNNPTRVFPSMPLQPSPLSTPTFDPLATGTNGNTINKPTLRPKRKRFELDFVHLDPVLSVHMRMQSMSMLGRGVIEFIHPEERERELASNANMDPRADCEIRTASDRGEERSICLDASEQSRRQCYTVSAR
jgi:hypothetical protein